MDPNPDEPRLPPDIDQLDEAERKALVSEWRKNREDLSWKPHMGHSLQWGPRLNKWYARFVYLVIIAGVVFIMSMLAAPREVKEVTATIIVAGKQDADGYTTVVVAIPGEAATQLTYGGTAQLRQGQQVVLEETSNRFVRWKSYSFTDPPE